MAQKIILKTVHSPKCNLASTMSLLNRKEGTSTTHLIRTYPMCLLKSGEGGKAWFFSSFYHLSASSKVVGTSKHQKNCSHFWARQHSQSKLKSDLLVYKSISCEFGQHKLIFQSLIPMGKLIKLDFRRMVQERTGLVSLIHSYKSTTNFPSAHQQNSAIN